MARTVRLEIEVPEEVVTRLLLLARTRRQGDLALFVVDLVKRELAREDSLTAIAAWEAANGGITKELREARRRVITRRRRPFSTCHPISAPTWTLARSATGVASTTARSGAPL